MTDRADVNPADVEKIELVDGELELTPKKIYEEVWACRNFEISNLWQRSVFLGTFMLAIAAGYGVLASNMLFPGPASTEIVYQYSGTEKEPADEGMQPACLVRQPESNLDWEAQLAAVGLCYLGITFSLLWVMMAKGSKMWYERYECAICYFTDGKYTKKPYDKEFPCYGNLPTLENHKISPSPFSPLAYYYSVSKINAVIGMVGLYTWGLLSIIHFGLFLKLGGFAFTLMARILLSVAQFLCLTSVLFIALYMLCKSGKDAR
ncbi:MAG: hypothetical protein K6G18_12315 [Treponema sp.]|nr:hypothetical protein [Treponema sp.]